MSFRYIHTLLVKRLKNVINQLFKKTMIVFIDYLIDIFYFDTSFEQELLLPIVINHLYNNIKSPVSY